MMHEHNVHRLLLKLVYVCECITLARSTTTYQKTRVNNKGRESVYKCNTEPLIMIKSKVKNFQMRCSVNGDSMMLRHRRHYDLTIMAHNLHTLSIQYQDNNCCTGYYDVISKSQTETLPTVCKICIQTL